MYSVEGTGWCVFTFILIATGTLYCVLLSRLLFIQPIYHVTARALHHEINSDESGQAGPINILLPYRRDQFKVRRRKCHAVREAK